MSELLCDFSRDFVCHSTGQSCVLSLSHRDGGVV